MYTFEALPQLKTQRLILRQILPSDVPAWAEVFAQKDVIRYLADYDTMEGIDNIVDWTQQIFAEQSGIRWAMTFPADDIMIGSVGFHLYDPFNRCAEVGYELHPNHWRQGVMTEALGAVLQFGFRELQLNRMEADVTGGNEASAGLLRGLGFTHEGTWREKVRLNGQFVDLWQFGLLKREYHANGAG